MESIFQKANITPEMTHAEEPHFAPEAEPLLGVRVGSTVIFSHLEDQATRVTSLSMFMNRADPKLHQFAWNEIDTGISYD